MDRFFIPACIFLVVSQGGWSLSIQELFLQNSGHKGDSMELKHLESLRIFVGEHVRFGHRPLYEEIVREARQLGMAGATVMKGVLSYGHDLHINTAKIVEFGLNLPMIVELVDSPENIDGFLPLLEQMVRDSAERVMITRESVRSGIIE